MKRQKSAIVMCARSGRESTHSVIGAVEQLHRVVLHADGKSEIGWI